jgi:hypothetical protein
MNALLGCLCLCFILQGCSAGLRDWPMGLEEDDRLIDGAVTNQTQAEAHTKTDALWDRFVDWAKMG